ncbi:hypothetical protein U0070_014844 [Myodes glareolus]|uniref:Ubiquitin-ribosomal protein eL40 fusion protein n=1 Tax=Myodes glareolus TaxID=447135 RepID=A0AAW0JF04_MYOGA
MYIQSSGIVPYVDAARRLQAITRGLYLSSITIMELLLCLLTQKYNYSEMICPKHYAVLYLSWQKRCSHTNNQHPKKGK